jgi:MOSC domain-containing protein YiiM
MIDTRRRLRSDKRRDPEMDGGTRKIVSIAVSKKKGTRKLPVDAAYVVEDHGLQEDAHSGPWGRQVSFLAAESIEESRSKGLEVGFGDFAENIATEGVDWKSVPIGSRVQLGESVIVEITQIGKECHKKCAIYYQAGDCIMPKEGVFGRVLKGGWIRSGDSIEFIST